MHTAGGNNRHDNHHSSSKPTYCNAQTPCERGECYLFPEMSYPICYEGDPCQMPKQKMRYTGIIPNAGKMHGGYNHNPRPTIRLCPNKKYKRQTTLLHGAYPRRGRLAGIWQLRSGKYRIWYTIEDDTVHVRAVKHKKDAEKRY